MLASDTPVSDSGPRHDEAPAVFAVVWTFNRFEIARRCVEAVLSQTRPAERVIVVDIASPDGSADRLRSTFPSVVVIELNENDGPGAAISKAFEHVADELPDYFWLVEDDSVPSEECLELAMAEAVKIENLGLLGPDAYRLRRGQWYATAEIPRGAIRAADLVMLDGALVSRAAVQSVGAPRDDYFIMLIDVEYPLRVARAGYQLVQIGLPYAQMRLGAAAEDASWRNYYQTRNHLRMAIDLRSPTLIGGFTIRTTKHFVHALLHRQWRPIQLRTRGIIDGLRGRAGRTLEPPASGRTDRI